MMLRHVTTCRQVLEMTLTTTKTRLGNSVTGFMISYESGNRFFPTAVTDYWQDKAACRHKDQRKRQILGLSSMSLVVIVRLHAVLGILHKWRVAWHKHNITYFTQLLPVIKFSQSYFVLNASGNYCILGELMKINAVRPGLHVTDYWRYRNRCLTNQFSW